MPENAITENEAEEHFDLGEVPDVIIPVFLAGAMTAGAGKFRMKLPANLSLEIVRVTLSALTAPVGSNFIVDINDDGTTIYTTQASRPTIVAGANDSVAANELPPDAPVAVIAGGSVVTIDIDQIGSGTAGSNLTVLIHAQKR
jgi:hypothetical protein